MILLQCFSFLELNFFHFSLKFQFHSDAYIQNHSLGTCFLPIQFSTYVDLKTLYTTNETMIAMEDEERTWKMEKKGEIIFLFDISRLVTLNQISDWLQQSQITEICTQHDWEGCKKDWALSFIVFFPPSEWNSNFTLRPWWTSTGSVPLWRRDASAATVAAESSEDRWDCLGDRSCFLEIRPVGLWNLQRLLSPASVIYVRLTSQISI